MRRVLVTGGAGFIGSHVAARFAADGFGIRVLDDLSTGQRSHVDPAWELVEADVRTPDAVVDAAEGCEAVVHLAAFTSVPESFERHGDCYSANVLGTFRVLDACVRRGVRRLVFASSSADINPFESFREMMRTSSSRAMLLGGFIDDLRE